MGKLFLDMYLFCHYFLDIKYKKALLLKNLTCVCCAADGPTRTVNNCVQFWCALKLVQADFRNQKFIAGERGHNLLKT